MGELSWRMGADSETAVLWDGHLWSSWRPSPTDKPLDLNLKVSEWLNNWIPCQRQLDSGRNILKKENAPLETMQCPVPWERKWYDGFAKQFWKLSGQASVKTRGGRGRGNSPPPSGGVLERKNYFLREIGVKKIRPKCTRGVCPAPTVSGTQLWQNITTAASKLKPPSKNAFHF